MQLKQWLFLPPHRLAKVQPGFHGRDQMRRLAHKHERMISKQVSADSAKSEFMTERAANTLIDQRVCELQLNYLRKTTFAFLNASIALNRDYP